jgi:DNA-binding GntR family transcriptional regulator
MARETKYNQVKNEIKKWILEGKVEAGKKI